MSCLGKAARGRESGALGRSEDSLRKGTCFFF
nr:MAG TPA: hypothetical protein [Caudoviricetes sp.]